MKRATKPTLGKAVMTEYGDHVLGFKDDYERTCLLGASRSHHGIFIGRDRKDTALLRRRKVRALVNHLSAWLKTGKLDVK